MKTTKLEQLSAAATQGEWREAGGDAILTGHDSSLVVIGSLTASENDPLFVTSLVNLYRTGQLVAVQADDTDKKMYLCKEHSHWYSYGQDCPLCSAALATKGDGDGN